MITVNWETYYNASCDTFNVYRSICGIVIPFPNSLEIGDQLNFAATSTTPQSITFTAVDIASIVSQFNAQALGAVAVQNQAGTAVLIRCTATHKARFKLYPCTFATHASLTPGITLPGLTWTEITSVARATGVYSYSYPDPDGQFLDRYQITSVKSSVETFPTLVAEPLLSSDLLCVVEGRVTDHTGRPLVSAKVRAQISTPPEHVEEQTLYKDSHYTYTDEYGRFRVPLIRCKIYVLEILDVGYNQSVVVPNLSSANFLSLKPTAKDQFFPFGDLGG
jgi:hypothetical protein